MTREQQIEELRSIIAEAHALRRLDAQQPQRKRLALVTDDGDRQTVSA